MGVRLFLVAGFGVMLLNCVGFIELGMVFNWTGWIFSGVLSLDEYCLHAVMLVLRSSS
jgi:hypothetical protein